MSSTSVARMGSVLARNCDRVSLTCSVLVHGHFCLLAKLVVRARRDCSSDKETSFVDMGPNVSAPGV